MNAPQRIVIIVLAATVAALFHVYFCEWTTATDASSPLFPLRHVKVRGAEFKAMKRSDLRTHYNVILSEPVSDTIKTARLQALATRIKEVDSLKDDDQFEAIFGIYPTRGLGYTGHTPPKRVAFYFGVIIPILVLGAGLFVAVGRARKKLNPQ